MNEETLKDYLGAFLVGFAAVWVVILFVVL